MSPLVTVMAMPVVVTMGGEWDCKVDVGTWKEGGPGAKEMNAALLTLWQLQLWRFLSDCTTVSVQFS